ncbi:MAG: methyltransferase domain-containing protein, partial [Actinomycetota bacterium]|nr:methyltransferase domain-containing protein [Actinomycetota bacterium]
MSTPHSPQAAPTPEQIRTGWDRVAAGFDQYVTPLNFGFGEDALRRIGLEAGMRFLDVAAGSGALAVPAARLGAQVVATDISPVMIERLSARARDEGLTNLQARVMDGTALELGDDTFDAAASQHGVSLFPEIDQGLRELARVTKPGGQVLIVAFGPPEKAEFLTFFLAALQAAVPGFTGPPMDPPPLPFQVADAGLLHEKLNRAGLTDVRVDTAVWDWPVRSATHAWDVVTHSNPIGAMLVADLTAEQTAEAQRVLDGMLRERSGG